MEDTNSGSSPASFARRAACMASRPIQNPLPSSLNMGPSRRLESSSHRSPADGDGTGAGNQQDSRLQANCANVGNECIGFNKYLCFWKKGRQAFSVEANAFWAAGAGKSAADDIGESFQLLDSGGDVSSGFLFARGYPIGGAVSTRPSVLPASSSRTKAVFEPPPSIPR